MKQIGPYIMIDDRPGPTYWNYTDANRVGGAIAYLQARLEESGVPFSLEEKNVKTDWALNDWAPQEEVQARMVFPLNATAKALGLAQVPRLGNVAFDYIYANALESLCLQIQTRLESMQWIYTNSAHAAGEEGGLFSFGQIGG